MSVLITSDPSILQLTRELPVYSDMSLGSFCDGAFKVVAGYAKSTFHCIWDCARTWNGGSCRSSGQWRTAALSAPAASANPYTAIDRPGTCSPYERSGVD